MRRFSRAALLSLPLACAFAWCALSQVGVSSFFPGPGSPAAAPPSYTGPCDVVACSGPWYGLRAVNAAYATGSNKAIQLQRTSDNTTQDIVILSNGNLDASTAATFCAATACGVAIFYDQSGTNLCSAAPCNVSPSNQGIQPQILFNCVGSLPCLTGNGNLFANTTTNSMSISLPWTTYSLCNRTPSASAYQACAGTTDDASYIGFLNSANTARFATTSGQITATETDASCHVLLGLATSGGTNSILAVDNSETTGTVTSSAISGKPVIMNHGPSSGNPLIGKWFEEGWWASGLSSANRTAIYNNVHSYWSGC
jgi:Alpha-L-arabinofuranosidase B, catalytic